MTDTENILENDTTKSLRTAMYMLRFTPEEKEELEQKVRVAAALGKTPLSLAEALRMGARTYLNDLIEKCQQQATVKEDVNAELKPL